MDTALTTEKATTPVGSGTPTPSRPTPLGIAKRLVLTIPVLPITVALYVVLALVVPGFGDWSNLQIVLGSMAVLAIAAIGMTLVFLVGGIDLSIGSTVALTSVVGAIATKQTGSIVVGLVVAVAVGLVVGVVNGVCVGYFGLQPFVVTLGLMLAVRAVAYILAAAAAGGGGTAASVGGLPPGVLALGQSTLAAIPVTWWISFVLIAIFGVFLSRTATGRRFYFVGSNEKASRFNGLSVQRTKMLAYTLAGGLGGMAGFVLIARLGSGNATAGDALLLQIIAATVIGGTSLLGGFGGVWRTLIGAFLIVGLTNALGIVGLASWNQDVIVGMVVIFGSGLAIYLGRFTSRRR